MNTTYDNLVAEYADLQARTAPDLARMDEIKKVLRDLDYGSHTLAGLTVSIARNARFDAAAFAAQFPPEERPEFYKPAVDQTAVKKLLPGAAVDAFQKLGEARVTIK